MPYDYYLEPENEKRIFTENSLIEMYKYLEKIPHYKADERLFYIFENDNKKEVAVPSILSRIAQGKNVYIYSSIGFSPTLIHLSIIGDVDVDRHIYDFVIWCQKHYPCQLYEGSEVIPPEELLFEEEFEVPRID